MAPTPRESIRADDIFIGGSRLQDKCHAGHPTNGPLDDFAGPTILCSRELPDDLIPPHDRGMNPEQTPQNPDSTRPASRNPAVENPAERTKTDEHEGATDDQVGDTTGPGVGYDQEPEQERNKGGVIPS